MILKRIFRLISKVLDSLKRNGLGGTWKKIKRRLRMKLIRCVIRKLAK